MRFAGLSDNPKTLESKEMTKTQQKQVETLQKRAINLVQINIFTGQTAACDLFPTDKIAAIERRINDLLNQEPIKPVATTDDKTLRIL